MNLANKITMSRIFIMPFFIMGIVYNGIFWKALAIICFVYASLSDWLDGFLARKKGLESDFGKFMDPLADKIFISSGFISFIAIDKLNIPAWMVIVIISREFMITGLRTLAISKGIVLPAKAAGKFKTTSQLVTISIILLILLIYTIETQIDINILGDKSASYMMFVPFILMFIVTLLTVVSGYNYIAENKQLFE
ncbi:CDP-diacylglycerol--glycerol-3-phosphate 3-phosphatidyltransferase [bacterium]